MPTYEYQCQKCRRIHEAFQSITAKPLTKCPRGGGRLKRLMGSGSGFLFRGSGFYITDYRSKRYQEAKKREERSLGQRSKEQTTSPTASQKAPSSTDE